MTATDEHLQHAVPANDAVATPQMSALAASRQPAPQDEVLTFIRPRKGWQAIDLRELWRYRDLLWVLTMREIQVRYKQTILGVVWAVLQPLMTTGAFAVLFALIMGRGNEPGIAGVPYFVSTFCAMLPWQLFANSLSQAGNSLVANQRLITKVYFPRLIIPLSAVLGALADFAIALLALIAVLAWYGIAPAWPVLALPAFVILAIMASLAVSLWLAALNALYRDFRHVIPFIVQLGLIISPVIYTTQSLKPASTWVTILYGLNPMVGVIEGFRWALIGQADPPGLLLIPSAIMTAALFVGGAYYFRSMERWFADLV
jgi:lipopolysaccharide transport system permease protein